jgi:hypothetical protein
MGNPLRRDPHPHPFGKAGDERRYRSPGDAAAAKTNTPRSEIPDLMEAEGGQRPGSEGHECPLSLHASLVVRRLKLGSWWEVGELW